MKTRALLVAMAALLLPGVARAAEWLTFKSEAGRFTVLMPGFPQQQDQDSGELVNHLFVSRPAPDRTFLVSYTEPKAGGEAPTPGVFGDVRDGFLKEAQATLQSERDTTFAGRPAREFLAKSASGSTMKARMVLDGPRLFFVLAVTPAGAPDTEATDRFLDSLVFAKS